MKENVGGIDKVTRVSLGIAFMFVAILVPMGAVAQFIWAALSTVLFVTAFSGYCPMNAMLGVDTRRSKERGIERRRSG